MKYQATIYTSTPETLQGIQPGQWISCEGSQGRYMGNRNGVMWIAWGATATKRFATFAAVYNKQKQV